MLLKTALAVEYIAKSSGAKSVAPLLNKSEKQTEYL